MLRSKTTKWNLFFIPALTGLLLAVLVLFHAQSVRAATYKAKGIDVSRWQGTIDWAKVKADGVEFAMIGIGRYQNGKGIPDTMFDTNMKNALAQGIKVGVYLYSQASTVEEARNEADFVLDQIDGYKISYPVAFDIEDDVHKSMTNKQRTDITIAFLEVIEEAGYYPMIYASESWFNSSMDLSRLTKYDKWVARWASTVSFGPLSMWQYSSTGKVSGISTYVDLDYSYKDYSKLIQPRTKAAKRRSRTGWQTNGTRYWYVEEDGTIPKSAWRTIDGKTYYFNKNGYRASGWAKIKKKYYYFSKTTGAMQTGWLTLSGKKYYLDPSTGVKQTGWITVNGSKYYLNSSGVLQTGWLKLSGKTYFLNLKTGKMRTGWLTYQKKTYYFNKSNGVMRKGWLTLSGKKYYMNSSGVRVTGWRKIGKKWYFFGPKTGAMQKNMKVGKYRLGSDGACLNR